ncbi:MAG TPA: 30S ribosomal protein S13 [Thermoplasmata archaeon]|nr:30S ribosomal protein S13 [Thermoplasmata archaeon]
MSRTPKDTKEPKEEAAPDAAEPSGPGAAPEKAAKKERGPKGKDAKEGKEAKEGKGKGRPAPTGKAAKVVPTNPNFRYIVRLVNTDLDGTRSTALALTSVHGVGLRLAETTCRLAHVDPHEMIGNLPEPTVDGLETLLQTLPTRIPPWMVNHPTEPLLGESPHLLGADLDTRRRDDINQMKMIRSYRGVRHERGQKVRGQRTRSNGRTGMAAGVLKKAAKEAAAAAGKEAAPAAAPAAPAAAPAAEKKA